VDTESALRMPSGFNWTDAEASVDDTLVDNATLRTDPSNPLAYSQKPTPEAVECEYRVFNTDCSIARVSDSWKSINREK
jgi:hypothetical protein